MTAKIIDGKVISEAVRQEAADEVAVLKQQYGTVPTLAAVLVGENPASQSYVSSKGKACEAAGMGSVTHRLPETATQRDVEDLVRALNANSFLEVANEGFLNLTTVYDRDATSGTYPAVHSRHFGIIGQPVFGQYAGTCKAK